MTSHKSEKRHAGTEPQGGHPDTLDSEAACIVLLFGKHRGEEVKSTKRPIKLAIGEALLFHNGIGGKRKEARLRYLSRYWMNKLKDVPKIKFNTSFDPNQSCAIANVQIEGTKPDDVAKYLFDKHHIFTVAIVHEEFQGLRITPNVYTTLGELDRFCEQMDEVARKGLPV